MSIATPVPSDVEPTSLLDLVQDCREVAGVLGTAVVQGTIDLTRPAAATLARTTTRTAAQVRELPASMPRIPLSRISLDRLPFSFGLLPAEITEDALALASTSSGLDSYGDYGS